MEWVVYPEFSAQGMALGKELADDPAHAWQVLTRAMDDLGRADIHVVGEGHAHAVELLRVYQRGLAATGVVRDAVLHRHHSPTSLLSVQLREAIWPQGVGLGAMTAAVPAITTARWALGGLDAHPHTGPAPDGHADVVATLYEQLRTAASYRLTDLRE